MMPIISHNGDTHQVSGAGQEHHVSDDIVMISGNGAAVPVSQCQSICRSRKDLLVAARQDDRLEDT